MVDDWDPALKSEIDIGLYNMGGWAGWPGVERTPQRQLIAEHSKGNLTMHFIQALYGYMI